MYYAFHVSSPKNDPQGPYSGQYRVLRGGAWGNSDNNSRAAYRVRHDPDFENFLDGFRCARSLEQL